MIYLWVFFVRRLCFSLLTVLCFDYPVVQVSCQIAMTLITTAFIVHQGIYKDQRRLLIEVFNELVLLVVSILLLHPLRFDTSRNEVVIGYSILAILAVLIIANIVVIVDIILDHRRQNKFEKLRLNRIAADKEKVVESQLIEVKQKKKRKKLIVIAEESSESDSSVSEGPNNAYPKEKSSDGQRKGSQRKKVESHRKIILNNGH